MLKKITRGILKTRQGQHRFSWITDFTGIKSAIGEMRGLGFPPQPPLNKQRLGSVAYNEAWFEEAIRDKILWGPENTMQGPLAGEKIFQAPLVGFIRGDDPIFLKFKEVIGPHHFTPHEILTWQARKNRVPAPRAHEISVVSFIMPLAPETARENAGQKDWPSHRWAQTRLLGEMFSQGLVRQMVTHLMDRGILAVAPDATPLFNKKHYPKVGWASPWSHRHMAYAAGLGTFGLHDFLITEKGAAHRTGSFVVHQRLSPNRERPDDIHASCLHFQGKKCLACASRCPVGAIDASGHDKDGCSKRVAKSLIHCNRNYHMFIYGCGLCSVKVPCATRIPGA